MAKGAYVGVPTTSVPISSFAVGSTVKLNVSGTPTDFIVVHHGNPNNTLYDASCDGTWLLKKDLFAGSRWGTQGSANNYSSSNIKSSLESAYLNYFDDKMVSAIKQVKIPYYEGYGKSIKSGSNGLSTKIFLLSGYEVGFTTSTDSYYVKDGDCLSYFSGATNAKRIAYADGTANHWWLRTGNSGYSAQAFYVANSGGSGASTMTSTWGVRPAIIVPPTLAVHDGFVDGSEHFDGSVARKVKKGYVGIDGKARKIKKGYIGIGGVARPCFGGEAVEYYGTITPLKVARKSLVATTVGNYALFGGGSNTGDTVDAYSESLTHSTPTVLDQSRYDFAATTVGNHALFGGGNNGTQTNWVDAYDSSLSKSSPTRLSQARKSLSATSIENYALFAGGTRGTTRYNTIDAYASGTLTLSNGATLSAARMKAAATSAGIYGVDTNQYAIFAGGYTSSAVSTVDAYSLALTQEIPAALSIARYEMGAAKVGGYALFAGGGTRISGSGDCDTVDAYNASLTRTNAMPLSTSDRSLMGATTLGEYALFGGGGGTLSNIVDMYDKSLTRTTIAPLGQAKRDLAATSVGNYALFAGGFYLNNGSSTPSDTVDAYMLNT